MSMANDVNYNEMISFLSEEKGWKVLNDNSGEYIFIFPLSSAPHIVIKVYSSISKKNDIRRKKGHDAIRVCAVNNKENKGIVKSQKVLRIPTWRKNLKESILDVFNKAQQRKNWK
jgi:hypothetical protein